MDTFNVVYRRLQDFDFRRDALHFDVPAYFFLGCYDVNATYWLAEDYFTKLQVPHKRLEFFEDSGRGNIWRQADKFHALMFNTFLPETCHVVEQRSLREAIDTPVQSGQ